MKIDFTKNVNNNSLYLNKYNILIKKNKIYAVFITVILYVFGIYLYSAKHVGITLWIFLACAYIIGIVLTYFQYKKLYDKNIASIQKSLEELKELEEE
jgi:Zn-dependent protease with chaperone function